ncbi:MAG: type I phosphomannose isomerase catalytic subunit [Candidatus Acidiferrum sp.]
MSASSLKPEPFRIDPILSPRIWGARTLAPLFPEITNLTEPIGEAWLTSVDCRIASGPFARKTLGEAWREMPAEWRGSRLASTPDFPLLVKFIFPTAKLSIQVHPDDAYASVHEKAAGGRGKTEMWYIVSAQPGATVLVGLKSGVDRTEFLRALASQTLEALLESRTVRTGDTIFVPAGTPHTIGPGMVICEVQQYSDLTYRVYDYGRVDAQGKPRELHAEKAMEVIQFGAPPILPFQWPNPMDEFGTAYINYLSACPYFAAERWELDGDTARASTEAARFEILIILSGHGEILWDGGRCPYSAGELWLLPASLGKFSVHSPLRVSVILRTYVPDIVAFENLIAKKGYSEEDRRRFIFS